MYMIDRITILSFLKEDTWDINKISKNNSSWT